MAQIKNKRYCAMCGQEMIKTSEVASYDTYTGKAYYYLRCPSFKTTFLGGVTWHVGYLPEKGPNLGTRGK